MLPLKVPVYNGLIEKVSPSAYMLNLAWPINPGYENGLRLEGYAAIPDDADLQHRPFDTTRQQIENGIYKMRVFFYYKKPKSFTEFPIKIGFRCEGPDRDSEGFLTVTRQTVPCNFLVQE